MAAAEARQKIPFWALPVVAVLPLWLFIYMLGMRPVVHEATGPLADGAEVYSNCSSCHGSGGEGGVGYQLSAGEVNQSFDTSEQMHEWVALGTEGFAGEPYGNGRHIGGEQGQMPAWESQLTPAADHRRVLPRVLHTGRRRPEAEQYADDFALWCAARPRASSPPRSQASSRIRPSSRSRRPGRPIPDARRRGALGTVGAPAIVPRHRTVHDVLVVGGGPAGAAAGLLAGPRTATTWSWSSASRIPARRRAATG